MKILRALFAAIFLATITPAAESRGPELRRLEKALAEAMSQTELNETSRDLAAYWDRRLQAEETAFLRRLDDREAKVIFIKAQQAWREYRAAEATFQADAYRGGSIRPLIYNSVYYELTAERVGDLRDYNKVEDWVRSNVGKNKPNTAMTEARTVSISIARSADDVYAYLAEPARIPEWSEFITKIRRDGDQWIATTATGEQSTMIFVPKNHHRVLDHDVIVSPTLTVHVPIRVLRNGEGSEVIFTIFRLAGMDDAAFAKDIAMVETDLRGMKRVLEGK